MGAVRVLLTCWIVCSPAVAAVLCRCSTILAQNFMHDDLLGLLLASILCCVSAIAVMRATSFAICFIRRPGEETSSYEMMVKKAKSESSQLLRIWGMSKYKLMASIPPNCIAMYCVVGYFIDKEADLNNWWIGILAFGVVIFCIVEIVFVYRMWSSANGIEGS